jgi:creatinine amidohydrolase
MAAKKNPFPVMEHMTVRLVREYLTKKKSIIIPVGVTEQHGNHLPLATDAVIATGVARRLGERTGILVGPTVNTSFSGGGLPGTINISPATMSLVISDMIVSLTAQGFRNVYILLCHGGSENALALDAALKLLLRTNPACEHVMIALLPIWKFHSPGMGWGKAFAEGDWHAGWLETSMVMEIAPELVRMEDLELDKPEILALQIRHPDNYQHAEKIVDDEFVIARMTQRPDITVGVMGHPETATKELGAKLVEDALVALVAKVTTLEAKADGVYKEVAFTPPPIILL